MKMDSQMMMSGAIKILGSLEDKWPSKISNQAAGPLKSDPSIILKNFDKQCQKNKRAAKFLDNSYRKYFTVNEIREMNRFFFEKVDLQS